MIRNYLKIAWRNIVHNKVYSAINILGLAAGMAVALIIGLWVVNQFSYDKFLPNYRQLYQVELNLTSQHDGEHTQTALALPLTDILRKEITGIKHVAETDEVGNQWHDLMTGDKKLYLSGGAVGADFLKMFQLPFVSGNANSALTETNSIVLTQSTAKALFGNADPIGKYIRIDNQQNLKVTAVLTDIPQNSTLQFAFLTPFSFRESTEDWIKTGRTKWTYNSFNCYVELASGVSQAQIEPKIRDLVYQRSPEMHSLKPLVVLHPVKYWHLYNNFTKGKETGGFIEYVRMFGIIGILVLIIACINFMNLSTARSEKRAREVGVRKAIGSQRKHLIYQFLVESILITFMAFIVAICITQLALPAFNLLTQDAIRIPFTSPVFWIVMITYVLLTGLLAGSRPAFYLSSFNPVKVLKGTIQVGKAATLPRKALVVLQFTCSIALIISTVIVYQQLQYAKNRSTGYSADRLVMTDMSSDLVKNYDALRNDLLSTGMVKSVASATSPVTTVFSHTSIMKWPGKDANDEEMNIGSIWVSPTYFKTVGMKLKEGRDFASDFNSDTLSVIVNEAAVKRMGLKSPLNAVLTWNASDKPVHIVGVVKDAVMTSPFTPVEPTIFALSHYGNSVIYRLSANVNTHQAIDKLAPIFNRYNPAYPYLYHFVNEEYDKKFSLETLVGKLAGIFAGLAIFISCLGLFGLAAYVAEQRTKEIGIRKVLGASISQVWLLLSRDFILLVVISCVIASPIALYFLNGWLQKYDYRITIGPGVFILSALAALAITMVTISFQAIKAAVANPVKSLRSE